MNRLNVPGPKAQALIERDTRVISSSYPRGYPFGIRMEIALLTLCLALPCSPPGMPTPGSSKPCNVQQKNSCTSPQTFIMRVGCA